MLKFINTKKSSEITIPVSYIFLYGVGYISYICHCHVIHDRGSGYPSKIIQRIQSGDAFSFVQQLALSVCVCVV
jgi:hypothetical protein